MRNSKSGVTVGLVGDFSAGVEAHVAIPKALELAAGIVGCGVEVCWMHTQTLAQNAAQQLAGCDAIWCVPASPYASMAGALNAIRFARESLRPFLGTCGGFQHAVIEFARHALGYPDADHAESNPNAPVLFLSRLACSLAGASGTIRLRPGTKAAAIYGKAEIVERYNCNFGVNPQYQVALEAKGLRIGGIDDDGSVRIIENADHPFFMATLFQPELSALSGVAHPVIVEFVRASAGEKARSAS